MDKLFQVLGLVEPKKERRLTGKEKERISFEKFVRDQLLKLKEKGLTIPVATL